MPRGVPKRWSHVTRVPAPAWLTRAAAASRCAAVGFTTVFARASNESARGVIPSTLCAADATAGRPRTTDAAIAAVKLLPRMGTSRDGARLPGPPHVAG
jgi:hypothetical protein